jgi:hypothetical protein
MSSNILSQYSNYDSDEIIYGKAKGGLNAQQEFRPVPQQIGQGAGLLVSIYSDTIGKLYIEFTNIIEPNFIFTEEIIIPANTIKTMVSPVKASYFRVRFINDAFVAQTIFKLNTYIIQTEPLIIIDAASSFSVDASGSLWVNIKDSSGNNIKIDSSGNLNTKIYDSNGNNIITDPNHSLWVNIKDSSGNNIKIDSSGNLNTHNNYYNLYYSLSFNVTTTTIESNSTNLNIYKNFDILIKNIVSTNIYPITLYLYVSDDNSNFIKTDQYLTINYADTSCCLLNCTVNSPYIKLNGDNIISYGVTSLSGVIYIKG